MLIAGFNFFIGLFNFVPLLPLDGGHIAGALWEAAPARLGPAARPSRPRATSTSPSCCRSPTSWPAALLVMGVVLIVGDLVVPVHVS